MPRPSGHDAGRFRVTDDTFEQIAPYLEVRTEHISAVNATRTRESQVKTRKGQRCRLNILINWWRTEYPHYYEVGTRLLNEAEKNDSMKFYHNSDRDLVYEGLCVDMVTAFMGANKYKPSGA